MEQKINLHSLPCGIQMATEELPDRHAVALDIRVMAGTCYEPADQLGLARLVEETLDKGTRTRTGRELADEFDRLGARRGSWTGREAMGFTCLCLPEFFERCIELHAEFLRYPTFPEDVFQVNVDLTHQELTLLNDDPQALTEKALDQHAWGPTLGRHPLGEPECLERIRRDDLDNFWHTHAGSRRMQISVAGPLPANTAVGVIQRYFEGYNGSIPTEPRATPVVFRAGRFHTSKTLEQQQIAMCYPGVDLNHAEFPAEAVLIKILSGGMSSRLFSEVREKRGLVYWVGAWQEQVRGAGMICFGASSTPENCEETYRTLLGEVERLRDDLTLDELDRAKAGIAVRTDVGGDVTRVRCGEMAGDLFYRGRLLPRQEKLDRLMAVTIEDIHHYLDRHPRRDLCVVTLGPKAPEGSA